MNNSMTARLVLSDNTVGFLAQVGSFAMTQNHSIIFHMHQSQALSDDGKTRQVTCDFSARIPLSEWDW